MPDLEDFDLDGTRDADGTPTPYRPEPPEKRRGLLFPTTLALAAIVALGLLAVMFFVFRSPEARPPAPTPAPFAPATEAPEPSPSATPVVVLPPLEQSDDFVRQLVRGLSAHPEIGRWLERTGLIRTLTVVTLNVAAGESPRPHLMFLAPKDGFRVRRAKGALVPDPAGFTAYDAVAAAVASLDARACADAYRTTEPLFDAAFEEFGQPGVRFRSVLGQAFAALLAVPTLDENVEVVPHATVYQYADPRLERLTPAQKQFLRMGPRHVRTVKARLREIASELELPTASGRRP